jgi:hypothetical protein
MIKRKPARRSAFDASIAGNRTIETLFHRARRMGGNVEVDYGTPNAVYHVFLSPNSLAPPGIGAGHPRRSTPGPSADVPARQRLAGLDRR